MEEVRCISPAPELMAVKLQPRGNIPAHSDSKPWNLTPALSSTGNKERKAPGDTVWLHLNMPRGFSQKPDKFQRVLFIKIYMSFSSQPGGASKAQNRFS